MTIRITGRRLANVMGGRFHYKVWTNPHCSDKWVKFNAKTLRKRIRLRGKVNPYSITEDDYQGKCTTKHKNIF